MINSQIDSLGAAISWAQGLDDRDFKWMLLLMAEDTPAINKYQRKGMVNEVINRMGL